MKPVKNMSLYQSNLLDIWLVKPNSFECIENIETSIGDR